MMARLQELDDLVAQRPLTREDSRGSVTTRLARLVLMEEMSWQQKARALWLNEGDKSSNFFIVWLIRTRIRILFLG